MENPHSAEALLAKLSNPRGQLAVLAGRSEVADPVEVNQV